VGTATLVAVMAVALLGGCGDDKPKTTERDIILPAPPTASTTTLPPAQLAAALKKQFGPNGTHRKLLEYAKASRPLTTGNTPVPEQCDGWMQTIGKVGSSDEMFALTTTIPDPNLEKAWHDDIAAKRLLIASCRSGQPVPANAAPFIKQKWEELVAAMAKHGFTI
jgi:hypothetical protein